MGQRMVAGGKHSAATGMQMLNVFAPAGATERGSSHAPAGAYLLLSNSRDFVPGYHPLSLRDKGNDMWKTLTLSFENRP